MAKFLYIFGYKTPQQARAAEAGPDENSEAFFIEAANPEEALAWGREVSEEFVRRLFSATPISWKSMNFSHGIEPESEFPPAILAALPCVKAGTYPDFEAFKS